MIVNLNNTDLDKCLCCGQPVMQRGPWVSPECCESALRILLGLGFTRQALLTKHRAQLDYQSRGFTQWLERQPT